MWRSLQDSKKIGIGIVLIYTVISCLWIVFSDYLLQYSGLSSYSWLNTVKGWFFVFITSLLLYRLIQHNVQRVQEREKRYRTLIENSFETVLIVVEEKIMYINKAGITLLGGKSERDIIGKSIFRFIPPTHRDLVVKRKEEIAEGKKRAAFIGKYIRLNGEAIYGESIEFPVKYRGQNGVQVLLRDITEQKKAEEKIHHLAYYDQLTGLQNRNTLNHYLNRLLESLRDQNDRVAVLFIDMDRFKIINDTMGHSFGDLMLIEVSKRLKQCVGESGLVARIGGDEFVIALPHSSQNEAKAIAQSILQAFSTSMMLNEFEFFSTPSIGISMYPEDGEDAESLIKHADAAMYLAKREGKNNYQFYKKGLNQETSHNLVMEKELRKAVENNEFAVWYQPQLDLKTGKVIGAEALLRWNHPQRGMVLPNHFIPLAEETGLICSIGEWVLKTACLQLKSWHEQGMSKLSMSVNISTRQFQQKDFIASVIEVLEETEVDPRCLQLEITESMLQNVEKSISILGKLKKMGINISIDDFGTGYSSLSMLKYLPVDSLKIDKSFVDDFNKREQAILKTILDMGMHLQLHIIAEGIENEAQLQFLKENNCTSGQGYLFSKPLPAEEMEKWLKM